MNPANDFDQDLKKKLMEIFCFSVDFFKKNNLRYFACGGTALGAVREHGIIPWDDDIDLYMPRSDYDRLLALQSEMTSSSSYRIVSPADKGYYLPYAKIIDTNTTIWEMKRCPFLIGVFIDIFPLDFFSIPKEAVCALQFKNSRLFSIYRRHLFKYENKELLHFIREGKILSVIRHLIDKVENLVGIGNLYLKRFEKNRLNYAQSSEAEASYCVCIPQWEGRVFNAEWFQEGVTVPFEYTDIVVPVGYDPYLTLLYGDYMTPPPIADRVSEHTTNFQYYLNLNEGLDLQAVQQRMNEKDKR